MKALFLLSLVLVSPLFALYNGNPSGPDMPELGLWISNDAWWGIKTAYIWDDTFDKKVKVKALSRASSIRNWYDTFAMRRNEGVLTFNISDRVEIYGKLGVAKLDLVQRPIRTVRMEYQTNNQFIWSVGGRIVLVYWEDVVMGVNALYSDSSMRIDQIRENGRSRQTSGACFKYEEWQVGVSFSREIGIFIPYIGLAYSSMNGHLHDVSDDPNFTFHVDDEELENREPFVLLLGLGLSQGKNVSFNLECRLIGEKAISLSGNIRF